MYRGIDVSNYQGDIDFVKVRESGIEAVIIRAGYGSDPTQEDTAFKTNIVNAKNAGLKVGVYWFCYARSVEDAEREAETCHNIIKDYELDYPVFYDFEEASVDYMIRCGIEPDSEKCSNNIISFCDTLKDKGYSVGIYSNPNSIANYLNVSCEKYDLWLARWVENPDLSKRVKYNNYNIVAWQYSNHQDGTIDGIGNVDCDMIYIEASECGYIKQSDSQEAGNTVEDEVVYTTKYKTGDTVSFNKIYDSSVSSIPLIPLYTTGVITRVIPGRANPYLIGEITGWVNDDSALKGKNNSH